MRFQITTVFTTFLLVVVPVIAQQSSASDCTQTARTQSELTRCAGDKAREADAELNRVYQDLLAKAKDDKSAVEKIQAAEHAWIKFRDAQLAAVFPRPDKQAEYGSMFPMCYDNLAAQMTRQRTTQLRRMLEHWDQSGAGCNFSEQEY